MSRDSLILGIGTALVGLAGIVRREWLLSETPKGRLLVESLGIVRARVFLVGVCLVILIFGALLAGSWLKPWRW
jgi:hypothetical protein